MMLSDDELRAMMRAHHREDDEYSKERLNDALESTWRIHMKSGAEKPKRALYCRGCGLSQIVEANRDPLPCEGCACPQFAREKPLHARLWQARNITRFDRTFLRSFRIRAD